MSEAQLEETEFDPFEEEESTVVNEDEETEQEEPDDTPEDEEQETTDEESEDEPEETKDEKMIPEGRFKAALKDVQDKLDEALKKNAEYEAQSINVPDREDDPEGYEQHLRLEVSKKFMMDFKDDYVEVIKHYQEMAKVSPHLNDLVAKDEMPAKLAYDLAKRDMEIRELSEARNSDEWKEFQEFKKSKGKQTTVADDLATPSNKAKLPKNLNRATASTPKSNDTSDEDYLWGDSSL